MSYQLVSHESKGALRALLLHCCHTLFTQLLYCCYTVVAHLLHCCYTVVKLSPICYTALKMLSLMSLKVPCECALLTSLEHSFTVPFSSHSYILNLLQLKCVVMHVLFAAMMIDTPTHTPKHTHTHTHTHTHQECIRARTLASRPGQGADVHVP
jgi:hypothetical protein